MEALRPERTRSFKYALIFTHTAPRPDAKNGGTPAVARRLRVLVEVGNATALHNRFGYVSFETLMSDAGRHLGTIASTQSIARLSDNAFLVLAAQLQHDEMDTYARTLRDGLGYQDFRADSETLRLRSTVGYVHLGHGFTDAGSVLAAAEHAARDARAMPISMAAYVPSEKSGTA